MSTLESQLIDPSFHQANISVRHAFVRKVYGILAVQLSVAALFVSVFVLEEKVRDYVLAEPWIRWVAIATTTATMGSMLCCTSFARAFPSDVILITIFTMSQSFLVGVVSAGYEASTVLSAFGLTIGIVVGLALFACQTRYDVTGMGMYVLVGLMSLVGLGILAAWFPSRGLEMMVSSAAVLVFGWYIVWDTQRIFIVGGKHRSTFTADESVFAALSLYLDVIDIFVSILRILGGRRRSV